METSEYYSVLGLPTTATIQEIKQAYKDLAMKYHPDKIRNNPLLNAMDFKNIRHAYQSLLKKNEKTGNIAMLKQLIDHIPGEQLQYYQNVLQSQDQSSESEDQDYLLEQTLSLNELKQMAQDMGVGDCQQNRLTLSNFKKLKRDILVNGRVASQEQYIPSKRRLLNTIRLKQPVFSIAP